jgi:hypothetical protein
MRDSGARALAGMGGRPAALAASGESAASPPPWTALAAEAHPDRRGRRHGRFRPPGRGRPVRPPPRQAAGPGPGRAEPRGGGGDCPPFRRTGGGGPGSARRRAGWRGRPAGPEGSEAGHQPPARPPLLDGPGGGPRRAFPAPFSPARPAACSAGGGRNRGPADPRPALLFPVDYVNSMPRRRHGAGAPSPGGPHGPAGTAPRKPTPGPSVPPLAGRSGPGSVPALSGPGRGRSRGRGAGGIPPKLSWHPWQAKSRRNRPGPRGPDLARRQAQ